MMTRREAANPVADDMIELQVALDVQGRGWVSEVDMPGEVAYRQTAAYACML